MTSLLDLPREIRDQIYKLVLDSPNTAPLSPVSYRGQYRQTPKCETLYSDMDHGNHFPREPPLTASRCLLRLNHQVRGETLAMLSHLNAIHGSRYVLDVMIENEVRLYPTWLLLPFSPGVTPHIDTVEAKIRIFGDSDERRSGWQAGDGGPGFTVWALLALIERFLLHGPEWLGRYRLPPHSDITIGTLDITVLSPTEPAGGFRPSNSRQGVDDVRDDRMLHPEAVMREMRWTMDSLLSRSEHTKIESKILYERVQRVRLSLDGKEQMFGDLSVLASMGIKDRYYGVRMPRS